MSYDGARILLTNTFVTAWQSSAFSSIPIVFEGHALPENAEKYVIFSINHGEGGQFEICSDAGLRYESFLQFDIIFKEDVGISEANRIADVIKAAFIQKQFHSAEAGYITCRSSQLRNVGVTKGKSRVMLRIFFQRDER
jgi:hypothetical protein